MGKIQDGIAAFNGCQWPARLQVLALNFGDDINLRHQIRSHDPDLNWRDNRKTSVTYNKGGPVFQSIS